MSIKSSYRKDQNKSIRESINAVRNTKFMRTFVSPEKQWLNDLKINYTDMTQKERLSFLLKS